VFNGARRLGKIDFAFPSSYRIAYSRGRPAKILFRYPNTKRFTSPLCHARRSAYFRVDRATTTVFNYRKSSRRVVNGVRNSSKYTCFLYALFVPSIAYLSFYIYIFIRTRTASFRIFILAPAPNSVPSPLFSHRRHLRPPHRSPIPRVPHATEMVGLTIRRHRRRRPTVPTGRAREPARGYSTRQVIYSLSGRGPSRNWKIHPSTRDKTGHIHGSV